MQINSTLTSFKMERRGKTVELPGQAVSHNVQESPVLRDETIHSYGLDQDQGLIQVQFSSLLTRAAVPVALPTAGQAATLQQVEEAQERLTVLRKSGLTKPPESGNDSVIPKDASFHPESYLMYTDKWDSTSTAYARQMAQVGQIEGFGVELITPTSHLKAVSKKVTESNVAFLGTSIPGACWTEDYGERTYQGGLVVPSHLSDPSLVSQSIASDRLLRLPVSVETSFSEQGAVSQGDYQRLLVSAGESLGWKSKEAYSHIEGGNMLSGTLPDGSPYALVGKDSVAVSRAKLKEDLGRPVSQTEALKLIASDLGVAPEHVHAIEQPGEFHLDMRMLCAAPGQVILNDARAAFDQQSEWLKSDHKNSEPVRPSATGWLGGLKWKAQHYLWERREAKLERTLDNMYDESERRAAYEDLSEKDLKAAGLRVDRMAAVFVDPRSPETDVTNFVNGRGGMDAQGQRFFVGLGADPRSEAYAAGKLLKELPTGFSRVHFLGRDLTPDTLSLSGGIKCRTKPSGHMATVAELMTPYPSRFYKISQ